MASNTARLNFLIQASENVCGKAPYLSQYYGQVLTTVAEKSAVKLDFTAKRRICRGCRAALVLGVNCTYRIRKKKSKKGCPVQVITCKNCNYSQKWMCKKGYKLRAQVEGTVEKLVIK